MKYILNFIILILLVNCKKEKQNNSLLVTKSTKVFSSDKNFSVLTYNAGLFELCFMGFQVMEPADYMESRLKVLPNVLIDSKADVVALQEVFLKKHQDFLIEKLQLVYPFYFYQRSKTIRVHSGLMVFSKYPLVNQKYYPFDEAGPFDEKIATQQGFLKVDIALQKDKSISLINIHTTSGGFLSAQDSPSNKEIRKKQIMQALNLVGEQKMILLGDFNTGPQIAPENYELPLKNGFTDVYKAYLETIGMKPLITWDKNNFLNKAGTHSESISQRIDHIYLSANLYKELTLKNVKRVFDTPLVDTGKVNVTVSDHYGLQMNLKFK